MKPQPNRSGPLSRLVEGQGIEGQGKNGETEREFGISKIPTPQSLTTLQSMCVHRSHVYLLALNRTRSRRANCEENVISVRPKASAQWRLH